MMNACCELGERLLKTEAKGISRTAQQRSKGVFENQVMLRIKERVLLDSFGVYVDSLIPNQQLGTETIVDDHFARKHPNFVYETHKEDLLACDRKFKERKADKESGVIDQSILGYLKQYEPDMTFIEIYNEVILRDSGQRVRASPNYNRTGPWYDYVNVQWDTGMFPAKCLCFYRKFNLDKNQYDMKALIHSVDDKSRGKVPGKMDTLLTYHYKMLYNHKEELSLSKEQTLLW
jgi:hypothetical protein